jgi:glucose-6-phosphate 1-epimerase
MSATTHPVIELRTADGARATIALDGAHVTSWIPAGEEVDRLFVSARSAFGPGASIRGGIPVIFPQFGAEGPLPRHGFARTSRWTLREQHETWQSATARFELVANEQTRAVWPFDFVALLTVTINGTALQVTLAIENTDTQAFSFTAALHPYFRVDDAYRTYVTGLQACTYRDALRDRALDTEYDDALGISGEIDRVYFDVVQPLQICEPGRMLQIDKHGFDDAVVWNPGASGTQGRADFTPGDERVMLCVEAAAVQHAVTLAPGAHWEGAQIMTAPR